MTSTRLEKNKKIRKKIDHIEKKETCKNIFFKVFKVGSILLMLIFLSFVVLRYVATSGIFVREYSKEYSNLPSSFYGFKVVQFTDLYYGSSTDMNKVNDLVKNVNKLKPDLVVFTGGLTYKKNGLKEEEKEKLIDKLSNISSTTGKYFVTSRDDDDSDIDILEKSGFLNLDDKFELIYYKGTTPIVLNGVKNIQNSEIKNQINKFNITISHSPDNIDLVMETFNPNIMLSGASFNGQLRLPIIGGIIRFDESKKYYDSYYKVNETDLYISNGIGTKIYPIRFLNHPSINLIRLR